jgi:hypothetical protein
MKTYTFAYIAEDKNCGSVLTIGTINKDKSRRALNREFSAFSTGRETVRSYK